MPAPAAPLLYTWEGDAFRPLNRFAAECDRRYIVGEVYRMELHEYRSDATHNHQFAWLKEAWLNLPEGIASEYPSPEHLRKRALIEAGYFDQTTTDAGSNAAAIRVAALCRGMDTFAHVVVRGSYVAVRTAKSQSVRAMGKADFQTSKTAIMDVIAAMIGTTAKQLERAGEMA